MSQAVSARVDIPATRLIPILALLAAFAPLSIDMYLSAFPDMQRALDTDGAGIASTLSVFLLGLALGQLFYGPLSDRYGRRRPLLAGAMLFCMASGLCLVSHDIVSFIALRACQALGGCCGVVLGRAMVRDLYGEEDIARIFSTLSMVSMAAPIVAPSLGIGIILIGGWRAIFAVLFLIGLASVAAIWFALPETLPASRRQIRLSTRSVCGVFRDLLKTKHFLFSALTAGSASGILFSFITGSSAIFITHFGASRFEYGAIFSAIVLAMIGGGQVNRIALRSYPPRTILRWALIANVASSALLVIVMQGGMIPVFIALLLTVAGIGLILPNSAALAISASGNHAGSAASLLGALQFGTGFLSSTAVALVPGGSVYPMALTIFVCALAGPIFWRMRTVA